MNGKKELNRVFPARVTTQRPDLWAAKVLQLAQQTPNKLLKNNARKVNPDNTMGRQIAMNS